jgi:hypothetical protein
LLLLAVQFFSALGSAAISSKHPGCVRHAVWFLAFGAAAALMGLTAPAAEARARGRSATHGRHASGDNRPPRVPALVAVQPIGGPSGPALRERVARLLRGHGFRVVTDLPAVTGTAQYPGIARDTGIAAFVYGGFEAHARTQAVTFLVWSAEGSVVGRWSVRATPAELRNAVGGGFWPHLGRALALARTPPSSKVPRLPPAPTKRIDASDELDEPIVSEGLGGFRPVLHRRRLAR